MAKIILCTGIDREAKKRRVTEIAKEFNERPLGSKIYHYNVGDYLLEELRKMGETPSRSNAVLLQERRPHIIEQARRRACESISSQFQKDSQGIESPVAIVTTRAKYWLSGISKGFSLLDDGSHDIFKPDLCINIVDDFQVMFENMKNDPEHPWEHLTKEELLSWRDEEFGLTELYWTRYSERQGTRPPIKTYWLAFKEPTDTLIDLIFSDKKKIYLSFPISLRIKDFEERRATFLSKLRKHFVVFDPYSIKEYDKVKSSGDPAIIKRVGHATVNRDLDLVEQSDSVVVYYPAERIFVEHPEGEINVGNLRLKEDEGVSLSAGVITEMVHAVDQLRPVYALWFSSKEPSPFFTYCCDATHGRLYKGPDAEDQFWKDLENIKKLR